MMLIASTGPYWFDAADNAGVPATDGYRGLWSWRAGKNTGLTIVAFQLVLTMLACQLLPAPGDCGAGGLARTQARQSWHYSLC